MAISHWSKNTTYTVLNAVHPEGKLISRDSKCKCIALAGTEEFYCLLHSVITWSGSLLVLFIVDSETYL